MFGRLAPDPRVQVGGRGAELKHVTEHRDLSTTSLEASESLQSRCDAGRIGVVGIVNNGHIPNQLHTHPTARQLDGGKTSLDFRAL